MRTPVSNLSRRRRIIAAAAAAALVVALLVVLAKVPPGVYRRTEGIGPDEAAIERFNEDVFNRIMNVLLDKSGGTRLDLEITEEMVNARLARWLEGEQQAGKPVPPVLRDARIGFEPDSLIVATRLGRGASSVVVSQAFRLSVGPDGGLVIRPGHLSAGLVPLPGVDLMGYVRRDIDNRLGRPSAGDDGDGSEDFWRSILDGLDGRPVPLGKGKKRIVLDRIEVDRGVLKVEGHRVEPPGRAAPK